MTKMISKKDLVAIGFKPNQAVNIIRMAKNSMVIKGFPYYNNKRVGIVPLHAVEEIIGFPLEPQEEQ